MALLSVLGLTKTFASGGATLRAVDDVSLELEKGEFVSVTGHSGSGKTTLLSMVGGLTRPTSGTVHLDGVDVHGLGEDALSEYRCERVGFVFQFASLLPALTARENLLLPLSFLPWPRRGAAGTRRALELLDLVGLADRAGAYPAELSGGQQRRVAIARALVNEPALVLADEPTGDLDEETEAEVMRLFVTLNQDCGTAFLMVTHNVDLALRTRRHLRMEHGRLLPADGRAPATLARPPATQMRSLPA